MSKQGLLFLGVFIWVLNARGQHSNIPLNTWRVHTNRTFATALTVADNKVWVGTKGGLFTYNLTNQTIETYTKMDGLPDLEVSYMGYQLALRKIIVTYANGDIYIINTQNQAIIQLPYVLNATNIFGSKKVNKIIFFNQLALLCADFGGVVVNLSRNEVAEAWLNIGPNGSSLAVYDAAVKNDSILLATSRGLLASRILPSVNLMDFNSWNTYPAPSLASATLIRTIYNHNQQWVAGVNFEGLYKKTDAGWQVVSTISGNITQINADANGQLYAATPTHIYNLSHQVLNEVWSNTEAGTIQNFQVHDSQLWMATSQKGLCRFNGNQQQFFAPQGPHTNEVFRLQFVNRQMFLFSGGYDAITTPQFKTATFSTFFNGNWQIFDDLTNKGGQDIVGVTYDWFRNQYLFASAWNGAIVKNANETVIINDNTVSCPLVNTSFGVRVTDVLFDETTGFSWMANIGSESAGNPSFFRLGANNTCQSYAIPDAEARYPLEIVIDNHGNKWARLRNRRDGGILVFNERFSNTHVPAYRIFRLGAGNGNLTNQYARCIVKDRNGDIWIGTENGVNVFYNTAFALVANFNADAVTPIFENRPLLFDQPVNCIAVDGGNRKWIGTGNGLYLFSADGTRQIRYFNTQNSPLMSDNIISLAIDPQSGEVFIATDRGVVSYREAATRGNDTEPSVVVFPNPIRSNYTGTIGITGLATDAVVKITDINGVLVHETTANGGTASWNGRDYNGRKIQPGVYIVLTAKDDGSSAVAGKLFVVD